MNRTTNIKVAGTYYYQGPNLFKSGLMRENSNLTLMPEPNNPHDKNAVAVYFQTHKIGHLNRDVASKYQALLFSNKVSRITISKCCLSNSGSSLDLHLAIHYEAEHTSINDCLSCKTIPNKAGVYEIRYRNEPCYVGSTSNLQKRCRQHSQTLQRGSHHNSELQNKFNNTAGEGFTFKVIKIAQSPEVAFSVEASHIKALLLKNTKLLNKTADGKGHAGGTQTGQAVYLQKRKPAQIIKIRTNAQTSIERPVQPKIPSDPPSTAPTVSKVMIITLTLLILVCIFA